MGTAVLLDAADVVEPDDDDDDDGCCCWCSRSLAHSNSGRNPVCVVMRNTAKSGLIERSLRDE